jgi:prepilin-type N-terminal cleavage/methylation domain-containing protein
MRAQESRGFSLIEVAAALVILAVITALLVVLGTSMLDANRASQTQAEMARMYTAVVGDPSKNFYGYIGDTGQFPSSLIDLVQKPASATLYGWNGPYITDARVESGVLYDPFGSPYECYYFADNTQAVADQFAIMSRGPDRASSNSAGLASNTCTSYNSASMPSNYGTSSDDLDNVVYPQFTDNPTLLKYNHVGRLSISLFNFDMNPFINALVPGCPHLFSVAISSVPRGSNDSFTIPYNPGADSVDLPQGLYKIAVTSSQSVGPLWQDQVAISPGATVSRSANIYAGLNSNVMPAPQTLAPVNGYGSTLTFLWFVTNLGNVANGATGSFSSPRGCSVVFAQTGLGTIVDSFVNPAGIVGTTTYGRRVNTNTSCTLTVFNRNTLSKAVLNEVLVYDSGVLIGVVTSRGAYKRQVFYNIKAGDNIRVYDTTSPSPNLKNTPAGTSMACPGPTTITITT